MIKKLLDSFTPDNYLLTLDIDAVKMKFNGTVLISGSHKTLADTLQLHSKGLKITKATINQHDIMQINQKEYDVLELVDAVPAGNLSVYLEFSADITDDMVGMYPCYFEDDGIKKHIIATQFESHYAREVFPCIDEPSAKATFDLTLLTTTDEPVLANTLPLKQEVKDNKLVTTFKTTPRMSTYLLAFVFGPMQSKEATTKDGVLVRSWASLAQPANSIDHSLSEAVNMIEFYDDYFGIPYPLEKCDQVALPDFDAGAMENWGLITYRETAMLTDPDNRSISSEQYVSLVIAHELSHQWFGNLVTMKWWDDLWLNESFASLMEYIAVDALHPEWQYWEEYVSQDAVIASNRDVYSDVQSVRVDVDDPAQISTLFDGAIVYAKGGRLLKMLREFIGEDAFRTGLKQYFLKHKYGNTSRDDLWNALAKSSGQDIGKIMNSWLEQSGQPIVSVLQKDMLLTVKQQRLLLDSTAPSKQTWQIPLLSSSKLEPQVISEKTTNVSTDSRAIVLLNQEASGHYVVKYETEAQLDYLSKGLKDQTVSPSGRIIVLNDMILLSKADQGSIVTALQTIAELSLEPRDSVWSMIASVLGTARMMVEGTEEAEDALKKFTYKLVSPLYEQLGWEFSEDEDANTTHLRRTILSLAVSSENEQVIADALSRYDYNDPVSLNAELRPLLMSVAVRFGKASVIDSLIELHRTTASPEVKSDASGALASTKDTAVASTLIALLKNKDHIRPQDVIRWYVYILRNQYIRDIAWQWLVTNWDWVTKTFESSKSYDAFPRYSASCFNSNEWLEKYSAFFTEKQSDLALERNIKIGIKEIKARVDWRSREQANIIEWLSANL